MAGLWLFFMALAVVYLLPGPDMILLLQTGARQGKGAALATAVGLAIARACHVALAHLTFRVPRLARLVDGRPQVLVRGGQLDTALMRQELLTPDDVAAALRAGGCLHLHEVERATMETNGTITVVLRSTGRSADTGL